ncbi:flagellar motor protein MotB [Paenibacillus darwinianus]|uniref:Flagellar motor protein MotB n=1 Tax=Paenibacillus darwinianus TaxID=1380763 RepID=A0A9W5RYR0_9BACL|nr:flagellar motor protein MotB [Paenibacillus darwinianus]EXX85318.1 flagellar motor protein MotB [Paenibacillus darwinianus]EXX86182.1 flagellar motor protein MotB [Paenibacillus darwinianus]EXX86520.1 flagellar motor protein MotB [Paenibacillus darwinianus]
MSKKHKHAEHEEHADETWLIPYADLLTLLLALFIVLYAMSSVDAKKFEDMSKAFNIAFSSGKGILDQSAVVTNANQMNVIDQTKPNSDGNQTMSERQRQRKAESLRQKEQQQLEKLKRQLDQYIRNNGLTAQLKTQLNQSQLLITISNTALFDSGSADIKQESRKLATTIGAMLEAYPGYEISVAGHTDNQPIHTAEFPSNYELSAKRAINFMSILLASGHLDPKLISPTGYGEFRPIATNATAAGRAKNRRVEISIIRKYTDAAATETLTVAAEQ